MNKRMTQIFTLMLAMVLFSQPVFGQSKNAADKPWSKFTLQLSGFSSTYNSSVRFGGGTGLDISIEDALGMDTTTSSFRLEAGWRFTKNLRHMIDFSWNSINRDGERTVGQDFTIENPVNPDGPYIVIMAGTKINSFFDIDLYKISYNYSFFQDNRIDLALRFGVFVMPASVGFSTAGLISERANASFTAPLPAFGIKADFAITPKWFLRMSSQIFYLEYEKFRGALYQGNTSIEFKPWKHFGIGLGLDSFKLQLEAEGEDYPGINFRGNVDFAYVSGLLYLKAYF